MTLRTGGLHESLASIMIIVPPRGGVWRYRSSSRWPKECPEYVRLDETLVIRCFVHEGCTIETVLRPVRAHSSAAALGA